MGSKKELKYYGGQGGYTGNGKITVKYGGFENKVFEDYDEAKEFYDSLNCGKALWQENPTELVHAHSFE